MPDFPILSRLAIDPGKRTIGELIQDRESAANEIRRLNGELERLRCKRVDRSVDGDTTNGRSANPRMLVRLSDLCELIGVSRSTIYKWMAEGSFPPPVKISERAVRWRIDEIESWRNGLT